MKSRFSGITPSPSMIVALVALIVALGGTSYAATQLAKNSVGEKQLKKNAVTTSKIKKNAVDSSRVKDRSLLSRDFKSGQLPSGPKGAKGATGPAGPSTGPAGGDLSGTYPNPSLADFPAARVKSAVTQSIPDSALTPVELDTSMFNIGGIYTAPNDQLVVAKRGTYSITGQIAWEAAASVNGNRQLQIRAGGSPAALVAFDTEPGTLQSTRQSVSGLARLTAGETISLSVQQNSGASLGTNVNQAVGGALLTAVWVGP